MNHKKLLFGVVGTAALFGLWAAFRPELLFVNKRVNESFPSTGETKSNLPQEIASGDFRGIAHETKGAATLYKLSDGKRTLRLTDFTTSNGPDVHVYLVAANDAPDSSSVQKAGFIDLGSIKGNEGDQNYDVPADTNLDKYQAVSIWCARFNVNFASASLKPSDPSSGKPRT